MEDSTKSAKSTPVTFSLNVTSKTRLRSEVIAVAGLLRSIDVTAGISFMVVVLPDDGSIDVTAGISFMVMVLPDDGPIGLPEMSVTAEPDMSSCGDAMAATELRWSPVSSMEITAESDSVFSVAPVSGTDCPESRMVSPDRSTMLAGVTSIAFENSISKTPVPSSRAADASSGSEVRATSIIGMPLPKKDAARAYVLESIVTTAMSSGNEKLPNLTSKLPTDAAGLGLEGSVMLIIWMPSWNAATMAYVEEPIVKATMPSGYSSLSNPPLPSCANATESGLEGSVMLIIWTALSCCTVTRAYVEEPMVAVVMPVAPSSLLS